MHRVVPLSPYGTSKLAAEEYLATWNRLYGTRHVSLRLGNVYGPRQDPHGEAGVVAIFLSRIRDGTPATIFGDGSQTRDYVFVGDVVRALRRARPAPTAASSTSARDARPRFIELYAVVRARSRGSLRRSPTMRPGSASCRGARSTRGEPRAPSGGGPRSTCRMGFSEPGSGSGRNDRAAGEPFARGSPCTPRSGAHRPAVAARHAPARARRRLRARAADRRSVARSSRSPVPRTHAAAKSRTSQRSRPDRRRSRRSPPRP